MSYCLFYNETTGTGAVGEIVGQDHSKRRKDSVPVHLHLSGPISSRWDLRSAPSTTGPPGLRPPALLLRENSRPNTSSPTAHLLPDGADIVDMNYFVLFYRASTGEGAIVQGLKPVPG